jgi:hypothetical protein
MSFLQSGFRLYILKEKLFINNSGGYMRKGKIIILLLLVLGLAVPSWAQKLQIDRNQLYLLLSTAATSTMQRELDEASANGFRVVMGSPTTAGEMTLFLERATLPPETYRYKLLATTLTSTMQKELNRAASEGFRLLPKAMLSKKQLIGSEIVTLMERPPRVEKRYEYKLLATNLTSTLEKEIVVAQSLGFEPVGMISRVEHIVILEREVR